MGNSSSTLEVSTAFQSLLSEEAPSSEKLESLLNFTLSDAQLEQVLPLATLRQLRHAYTRNFALVLHLCIQQVGLMAARKKSTNTAGALVSSATIPAEALSRFYTALQVLRRFFPVAMEDGNTSVENVLPASLASGAEPPAVPADATETGEGRQEQPAPSLPITKDEKHEEVEMQPIAPDGSSAEASSVPPAQTEEGAKEGEDGQEPSAEESKSSAKEDAHAEAAVPVPTPSNPQPTEAGTAAPAPEPTTGPRPRTKATMQFPVRFFLHDSTCDDAHPSAVFAKLSGQTPEALAAGAQAGGDHSKQAMPLGTYLVWALVECCFIRGLTLSPKLSLPPTLESSLTHPEVVESLLWAPGLGSADLAQTLTQKPPSEVLVARAHVLRAVLSVCSSVLFHPPCSREPIFLDPLVSTSNVPLMPTLAVSLLNTVMTYVPYGMLPYTSHVVSDEEQVVVLALHVLCATLNYEGIPVDGESGAAAGAGAERGNPAHSLQRDAQHAPRTASGSETGTELPPANVGAEEEGNHGMEVNADAGEGVRNQSADERRRAPSAPTNTGPRLVHCVRKTVHDISLTEAKLLVDRLSGLVGLRVYASQTVLPDSQRRLADEDELMVLLWRLIELSPSACMQFSTNPNVLSYLVPLMQFAMDAKTEPRFLDHLQIALFILSRLSEMRSFCLLCNEPFVGFIPFPFPKRAATSSTPAFPKTFNDFLVTCLCQLLEARELAGCPLAASCSIVLANLAPFVTVLGPQAAMALVEVFTLYASRTFKVPLGGEDSGRGAASAGKDAPPGSGPDSATNSPPSADGTGEHSSSFVSPTVPPGAITPRQADRLIHLQSVLVNVTEAIASVVQYHETGARYLIAALVDHAATIHRAREVYLIHKTRPMLVRSAVPFLVDVLDSAVALARPLVESVAALSASVSPVSRPAPPTAASSADGAPASPPGADVATGAAAEPPAGPTVAAASESNATVSVPAVSSAENPAVIAKLDTLTLVGALPTPHRITTRRVQSTRQCEMWAMVSFWSKLFLVIQGDWLGDSNSVKLLRFSA